MTQTLSSEPVIQTGDHIELHASADELRRAQVSLDPALNGFLMQPALSILVETARGIE